GEGTYIVQGKRVTDAEARAQMSIPEFEDCVEVTTSEHYCWRRTALELITSEQRDELITTFVERDAFHLELKDAYATAIEDGPFAKWLKGEPDDFAWLMVDTYSAELTVTQPRELALYAKAFALLHRSAVYGRPARDLIVKALADFSCGRSHS
ncbi:MAG: DUF6879 family protein, partial [Pseudonocardiaceae bacterium]